VPTEQVEIEARRQGATAYDTKGAELGHHGSECSFDAIVHRYQLGSSTLVL
jgi:hypothetical protein